MKAFEYYAPAALEEAFDLLDRFEAEGKLLNGGTDVVIQLREKLIAPKAVIDIKRIPGLRGIAYDPEHGLTIGACVTMNELGNEALVCTHYPTLAKAALSVGSKQVRNRATCAGNLINASPLADTATPLLAYGASVVAVSRGRSRWTSSSSSCARPVCVPGRSSPPSGYLPSPVQTGCSPRFHAAGKWICPPFAPPCSKRGKAGAWPTGPWRRRPSA